MVSHEKSRNVRIRYRSHADNLKVRWAPCLPEPHRTLDPAFGRDLRPGSAGRFGGVSTIPPNAEPAARPSAKDRLLSPRAEQHDGRLVVRYANAVVVVWIALAIAGLGFGFASVGGDDAQAGIIGLLLGVICTFAAWFAVRPVVVADRSGIAVLPIFGTRTTLRWSEVHAIGVQRVKAARGRGDALMIDASDDREVKVDGLWVGLTGGALRQIEQQITDFADAIGVVRPPAPPVQNENVF